MAIGDCDSSAEDAARQVPWASSSLGDDPHLTMEILQRGLSVDLIATARSDLETCSHDEMLTTVVDRNRRNQFDFLPVLGPAIDGAGAPGRIIGLIEIAPFMSAPTPDGQVHASMRALSEENLIGADASILDFVRNADLQVCRLVVSGHEISGLVTLSDLQRLPVRVALFGLVTHLEITMANAIHSEFGRTEGWIDRLPENRQQKLRYEIAKARGKEGLVDALLFTQFADKVTIIRTSPYFLFSKNNFKNELEQIRSLRDHLVHANDYAASVEAASQVCRTARLVDKWSKELWNWPRSASAPPRPRAE